MTENKRSLYFRGKPGPRKKPSTRTKGIAFERRSEGILIDYGWMVHNSPPSKKAWLDPETGELHTRNVDVDIFGCIDLIAKKPEEKTLWIQCGEPKSFAQKKRDLAVVPWTLEIDEVQIWLKMPDRQIKIYRLEDIIGDFEIRRSWFLFGYIKTSRAFAGPENRFSLGKRVLRSGKPTKEKGGK